MKLYYTNSVGEDQIQANPKLSLGGYKALSPLPNNVFDNLFGEISQFLLAKEIPEDEYIGIILLNELGTSVENLWLWFDYPTDSYSKFLVACVDLTVDSDGVLKMERIPNRNSKPLYADFYEADGIENAVAIGNIAIDGSIGLWFQRQLVEDLVDSVQADAALYETDPNNTDLVRALVPTKFDSIKLCFRYGSAYYGGPIGDELI